MTHAFPRFFRVKQKFDDSRVTDLPGAVRRSIGCSLPIQLHHVKQGQSVCIAIGSRGISEISVIAKNVVEAIRELGAVPFIIPAMGSHGGATAEGQAAVLAGYGITPETMGCEVRSSMQTAVVGMTSAGVEVHVDVEATKADHVVIVNRIKPHTRIIGPYESGLVKMMLIGLGKHRGASEYHRAMTRQSFDEIVAEAVPMVMSHVRVLLGVAVVENAFDQISHVEAIEAEQILNREPELLDLARTRMPRLPFKEADLVIIDRIGKNISGSGMDTNVVGRKANDKVAGPNEWPKVHQIYVRGLTPETKGNASGIGIAEYCRARVVREMDVEITNINCLTALHVTAASIPAHWETDREVLAIALGQSGRETADVRWVWIPDTLHVAEVVCSEAYFEEAKMRPDLEIVEDPRPIRWDEGGGLHEAFEAEG
jgi:hypothetical protein